MQINRQKLHDHQTSMQFFSSSKNTAGAVCQQASKNYSSLAKERINPLTERNDITLRKHQFYEKKSLHFHKASLAISL